MAICTNIVKLEPVSIDGDLLEVTIDNVTRAYWIYDYTEALKFLNKEVIVDYRKDIYKGELRTFIATFTIPTLVTTLDKEANFKLYIDQKDNISNVVFREIEEGGEQLGAIVFCTQSTFKSSQKATWQELIIRDSAMRVATLRLFDYTNKEADFSGKYIKTNLKRNQYGFQCDTIKPLDNELYVNPEIALAKKFIMNYFANDDMALSYIDKTKVLDAMELTVDYEQGYSLMRLAMQLSLIDSMHNISKDVDLIAIGQAMLLEYGYLTRNSALSRSYTNISTGYPFMFPNRKLVMRLLDEALDEKPVEHLILNSIKSTVDTILQVRKGTLE